MARLHQSGFELNSLTSNVEWSTLATTGASITTAAARSGTYGLRLSGLTSATAAGALYTFTAASVAGPLFLRININIQTLPGASNHIISFNSATGTVGGSEEAKITLETDGTLVLRSSAGTQIGSASAALSTGRWYMIDLKIDANATNGSRTIEGRLEGSMFATSSAQTMNKVVAYSVGANLDSEANTTGEWWFDDIALNDSTGSFQTSYPGQGKILHLKPNATGDVNTFSGANGGTAGASNNFTRVNDVPPDSTSYNTSNTLNNEDLFNVDDSGIAATDTVNVVMVGVRLRNAATASDTTAVKVEIEKTSGGTIAQGTSIVPTTTSFVLNSTASPHNYTLITYQDPDSGNWTKTTLDSMQIGYKLTATGTSAIDITALWSSVDFTPSNGSATSWWKA